MLNRRQCLAFTGLLGLTPRARAAAPARIETVRGPIEPAAFGFALPHEHILVDFIGADRVTPDRYDLDDVIQAALPHLQALKDRGVASLVECTPAYLGRAPALLRRLSQETGLHLLTNTGYYAANGGKHLPLQVETESPRQLADRWIDEAIHGIDGTGIRPGFLKIGFDRGPLGRAAQKLVDAAALTHLETGLTIAAHSGDGSAATEAVDRLERLEVAPSAFVWVHAQNEQDPEVHRRLASRGAWVEFDGIGPETIDRHVQLVLAMKRSGLLSRVLISQDSGWYHVGETGGGEFRGYISLVDRFLPAIREAGLEAAELHQITRVHPATAFTIAVRRREM